ncbi:MAG TPA: carbamoyltransferase C-terminal domain-containing protein [Longimicrobiaceae bacterium]
MPRNYIGLATTLHDPAVAVVNSAGEVVFAEGTERHLQSKRALNHVADPAFFIEDVVDRYCEPGADLVVVKSWNYLRRYRIGTRLYFWYLRKRFPHLEARISWGYECNITANRMGGRNTPHMLNRDVRNLYSKDPLHRRVETRVADHHLTHAANAGYSSAFDEALCAVVDGYGEYRSFDCFRLENGLLHPVRRLPKGGASLGQFYTILAEICGFETLKGEEWKLMGLSSYGSLDPKLYALLDQWIRVENGNVVEGRNALKVKKQLVGMTRRKGEPALDWADLAHTGHQVFCDRFAELLCWMHAQSPCNNLALSGGCALNSAWAGKILERTPFKRLYIPPAPADDGNAIGAAYLGFVRDHGPPPRRREVISPYLGSAISARTVGHFRRFSGMRSTLPPGRSVCEHTAELLARGKIVGWVQGRAEFGPRALGNRSILADPRRQDIKEVLNAEVKFREEFRPFAPAILHEHGDDFFENYQESPYMDRALTFRPEVRHLVPGVVHVDGTGRLQTVKREWNERFHDLIRAFHEITGVPILLNTSFNVMGKPIIHSLEDALAVFLTSGLDVLVVGDDVYEKEDFARIPGAEVESSAAAIAL